MSNPDDFQEPPEPTPEEEIKYLRERISQLEGELRFDKQSRHNLVADNDELQKLVHELQADSLHRKEEIIRLESSLAELQRVVQIKDDLIKQIYATQQGLRPDLPIETKLHLSLKLMKEVDYALALTPKNCPKFVTEQEYLRVKEENDVLKLQLRTGICIDLAVKENEFDLLKSHAEAMANAHDLESVCFTHAAYRKDFPGSESPLAGINESYRKDFPK